MSKICLLLDYAADDNIVYSAVEVNEVLIDLVEALR